MIYNVKSPTGQIIQIQGPAGASQSEVIRQAQKLFAQQQTSQQQAPQSQAAPQSPVQGVSDFLGTTNFGRGIGQAIAAPGVASTMQQTTQSLQSQIQNYLQQRQQAIKSGDTAKADALKKAIVNLNNQMISQPSFEKTLGGDQGVVTPGQMIGSGLSTAANIALLGTAPALRGVAGAAEGIADTSKAAQFLRTFGINAAKNAPAAVLSAAASDISKNKPQNMLWDIPLTIASFGATDSLLGGLGRVGKNLTKAGQVKSLETAILGAKNVGNVQLEATQGASRSLMSKMVDYGAKTLGQMKDLASSITGETRDTSGNVKVGILTDAVRKALSRSKSVDMTEIRNAANELTGARISVGRSRASVTTGMNEWDKKIYNTVKNGIARTFDSTSPDISKAITTNNEKALSLIQDLQRGRMEALNAFKSSGDAAASNAVDKYQTLINKTEDLLFNKSGANKVLVSDVLDSSTMNKINQLSPKLGQEVQDLIKSGGTIKQLRSLQAPFVQAGQLTDMIAQRADKILQGEGAGGTLAKSAVGGAAGLLTHTLAAVAAPFLATPKVVGKVVAGGEKAAGASLQAAGSSAARTLIKKLTSR